MDRKRGKQFHRATTDVADVSLLVTWILVKQDNVQVNTESVQCICIAYSEVRISITEISEQLSRVDQIARE